MLLLNSSLNGLKQNIAQDRLKHYGANQLNAKKQTSTLKLFIAQFKNSIILILLFATGLSFYLNQKVDAAIILTIIFISGSLGMAPTIPAARQLVNHGHICVNSKRVSIPSYQCQTGDTILVRTNAKSKQLVEGYLSFPGLCL